MSLSVLREYSLGGHTLDDVWEWSSNLSFAQVAAISGAVVGLGVTVRKLKTMKKNASIRRKYAQRIERERTRRRNQLQQLEAKLKVNGVLVTENRKKILNLPSDHLVEKLRNGELKSVEVLHAFQAKAIEATRKCNCVIEFINEAEEWAKAMDQVPKRDLPFHGLPVSIKGDFDVADYDSTLGLAKFLEDHSMTDSGMVKAVKKLGGVPFCRTNFPQVLFSYSSDNPVYGLTTHPTHPDRTSGGSSSGEAALIALGGSVVGIGSDIGGSLRIPTHFCGIASIKPTAGRMSMLGKRPTITGVQGVLATPGVMGRDAEIVAGLCKGLFSENIMYEIDPTTVPVPWRDDMFNKKGSLRVGYVADIPAFPATPGCQRAVRLAADALKAQGHHIIPFEFMEEDVESLLAEIFKICFADNGIAIAQLLEHETVSVSIKSVKILNTVPEWIRRLLQPLVHRYMSRHLTVAGATSSRDLMLLLAKRTELIKKTVNRWKAANIDVWLVPAFACPAMNPNYPHKLLPICSVYTASFNYLNFPAGIVPVTHESKEDQELLEQYDHKNDYVLKLTQKVTRGGENLPIGVQIVGLPWEEETVLRAMKELQRALKSIE